MPRPLYTHSRVAIEYLPSPDTFSVAIFHLEVLDRLPKGVFLNLESFSPFSLNFSSKCKPDAKINKRFMNISNVDVGFFVLFHQVATTNSDDIFIPLCEFFHVERLELVPFETLFPIMN